jgi:hypothetical protein
MKRFKNLSLFDLIENRYIPNTFFVSITVKKQADSRIILANSKLLTAKNRQPVFYLPSGFDSDALERLSFSQRQKTATA